MRFTRNRPPISIDVNHMKALHAECIEQLELMRVSLESAQLASDLLRDQLDDIATEHWYSYIDVIHLLCLHDDLMAGAMKKIGLDARTTDLNVERQYQMKRILLLSLIQTLIRHHHRIISIYCVHGEPMKDYLTAAEPRERQYLVNILAMIHHTL